MTTRDKFKEIDMLAKAQSLNGKRLAKEYRSRLHDAIAGHVQKGNRSPGLAVIQVGQNPASSIYVRHKVKACKEVGILTQVVQLSEFASIGVLLAEIDRFNADAGVDGVLVQYPLPEAYDLLKVQQHIALGKDVDGLHPFHLGRLGQKQPLLRPCTPLGVMRLLASIGADDGAGKHAVVVGASNIVGRPMALELLLSRYTVTITHSATANLSDLLRQADLVVAAVGKPGFIHGTQLKSGAIVIDVGINRLNNGTLVGDVDYPSASQVASWITPVPGGVGPMTVAMLLQNTFQAYQQHQTEHCRSA